MIIEENLRYIKENIANAAKRCGRNPEAIKLVAVSKKVSVARIREALAAGVKILGENRVQEMLAKQPLLPSDVEWHFIGHLQTNKVKYIIKKVHLIHSLDSLRLAQKINLWALKEDTKINVLVQVNVSGETTKYGLPPDKVIDFIWEVSSLPGLVIRGLMTIAPAFDNPEEVRPVFRKMRRLFEEVKKQIGGANIQYLSMGMTNDYVVAVEEGANILRIGTAIFGERRY